MLSTDILERQTLDATREKIGALTAERQRISEELTRLACAERALERTIAKRARDRERRAEKNLRNVAEHNTVVPDSSQAPIEIPRLRTLSARKPAFLDVLRGEGVAS